jgi:hypothetical protein
LSSTIIDEDILDFWMGFESGKVAGRSTLKRPLGSCPVISAEESMRACADACEEEEEEEEEGRYIYGPPANSI